MTLNPASASRSGTAAVIRLWWEPDSFPANATRRLRAGTVPVREAERLASIYFLTFSQRTNNGAKWRGHCGSSLKAQFISSAPAAPVQLSLGTQGFAIYY